jgi:hypothetical protein
MEKGLDARRRQSQQISGAMDRLRHRPDPRPAATPLHDPSRDPDTFFETRGAPLHHTKVNRIHGLTLHVMLLAWIRDVETGSTGVRKDRGNDPCLWRWEKKATGAAS